MYSVRIKLVLLGESLFMNKVFSMKYFDGRIKDFKVRAYKGLDAFSKRRVAVTDLGPVRNTPAKFQPARRLKWSTSARGREIERRSRQKRKSLSPDSFLPARLALRRSRA